MKCGISQEELERDAFGLIEEVDKEENPFTKEDVLSALEGYDSAWFTYPIEKMSYKSDIPIQKNKRNFRTQVAHLKLARFTRDLNYDTETDWINKDGAPKKQDIVLAWYKKNPNGKKAQCIKKTGLSKPTVYKWWTKG